MKVKDDQIAELTREIQMYYGIKRHIEELNKKNQAILMIEILMNVECFWDYK